MAKLKSYKGVKGKADKLFSEVIRSYGECEKCGGDNWLQTAHIISRRFNSVRTDTRNAFCLCASCHRKFTDHPREFSHFITDSWAVRYYDRLYWKSQEVVKVDWALRIEFLTRIKEGKLSLREARELED